MALLNILHYPDPRLRKEAKPVSDFTPEIKTLVSDMLETMYEANGIGLAATQVNIQQRVIVIDISETRDKPLVLINPEILESKDECDMDEGCLSVPGIFDTVTRAKWIKFKAYDENGKEYIKETNELLARCVLHEIDHLDGKVFVDYLSKLKQNRVKKKLDKWRKQIL